MKKITSFLILLLMFSSLAFSQEKSNPQPDEKKPAGVTLGFNYWSTCIYRGFYYHGDGGATGSNGILFPYVNWKIFDTGLGIYVGAEISDSYIFDMEKGQGYEYLGIDFILQYSHTFVELVTIGLSAGYFYYPLTKHETGIDRSLLITTFKLAFEVLLSPFVSLSYDYYNGPNWHKDFYLQFGIGHSFELAKKIYLNLSTAVGYYYFDSGDMYGISDIDTSAGLSVGVGMATFTSSFHYIAVPTKEFYAGGDIHKWIVKVGVGCTF